MKRIPIPLAVLVGAGVIACEFDLLAFPAFLGAFPNSGQRVLLDSGGGALLVEKIPPAAIAANDQ